MSVGMPSRGAMSTPLRPPIRRQAMRIGAMGCRRRRTRRRRPLSAPAIPIATLTTNKTGRRSEPAYKHHTAVDAERGVVLDVAVTTGAVHDTKMTEAQLDAITATTGVAIQVATMDASYAITRIFADLEARDIEAI
ncbi:transposase, partial [Niveispirillum sp. SYP-B3756]|nr:transposase [Niveispirillum sp. SYP-B3756]